MYLGYVGPRIRNEYNPDQSYDWYVSKFGGSTSKLEINLKNSLQRECIPLCCHCKQKMHVLMQIHAPISLCPTSEPPMSPISEIRLCVSASGSVPPQGLESDQLRTLVLFTCNKQECCLKKGRYQPKEVLEDKTLDRDGEDDADGEDYSENLEDSQDSEKDEYKIFLEDPDGKRDECSTDVSRDVIRDISVSKVSNNSNKVNMNNLGDDFESRNNSRFPFDSSKFLRKFDKKKSIQIDPEENYNYETEREDLFLEFLSNPRLSDKKPIQGNGNLDLFNESKNPLGERIIPYDEIHERNNKIDMDNVSLKEIYQKNAVKNIFEMPSWNTKNISMQENQFNIKKSQTTANSLSLNEKIQSLKIANNPFNSFSKNFPNDSSDNDNNNNNLDDNNNNNSNNLDNNNNNNNNNNNLDNNLDNNTNEKFINQSMLEKKIESQKSTSEVRLKKHLAKNSRSIHSLPHSEFDKYNLSPRYIEFDRDPVEICPEDQSKYDNVIETYNKDVISKNTSEWSDETYENPLSEDHRLFCKFQKILQRSPEQCIRYWRGYKPIICTSNYPSKIPVCKTCGAPRLFEFQITPGILNFLQIVKTRKTTNLEFLSIVGYVCSANCQKNDWNEEYIVTQLES